MTDIERVVKCVDWLVFQRKVKSRRDLADNMGYTESSVSQILNKKVALSERFIKKLSKVDGAISEVWLLTGEGEMLKRDGVTAITNEQINYKGKGTPIYDLDATCGKEYRDLAECDVIGFVDLPTIRKDCHILTACGDSMEPKIKNGDKVALREVYDFDCILFGHIYLIHTNEYRMLKYIRKHPTDNTMIILRSENKDYDDVEIHKTKIRSLAIVENILCITNML